MCWSVGKSKSSNCLQLSLQIPATDSKTHMLLRDLWEVLILFDVSVHPHLPRSPHGLHSPFLVLCIFSSNFFACPVFQGNGMSEVLPGNTRCDG